MPETIPPWSETNMATCIYVQWLGVECPGCGMQRAFVLLLKGEIWESIKMHPALIPLILFALFVGVHLLMRFRAGGKIIVWWMVGIIALSLMHYGRHQAQHFY